MARDWIEILKRIEGAYPQAIGGASHDDTLRALLVPWANDVLRELDTMQRWSYNYVTSTFTTVAGTARYTLPVGVTAIKNVYYISSTGSPVLLDKREWMVGARLFGDTEGLNLPVFGAPRIWSLNNRTIELFPTPNAAGFDVGGNYIVYIQSYNTVSPIVETAGTITGAGTVLTVPSTAYLTDMGILTAEAISIRGAGNLQLAATPDTFITANAGIVNTTTLNVTTAAPATATAAQTFFNSQPWVTTWWPKVMEFAILREAAAYLRSADYQTWEGRYQQELKLLRDHEYDRGHALESKAAAHAGQETNEERRLDMPVGMDIRGAV